MRSTFRACDRAGRPPPRRRRRDRYRRELEAVYGAEGPARFGLTLERLLAGLDALGVERKIALEVVFSVALDSTPPLRRNIYRYLCEPLNPLEPPRVTRRRW